MPGLRSAGRGRPGKVYLLRNVQGEHRDSGYEVWDVTNVTAPVLVSALRNFAPRTSTGGSAIPASPICPGSKDATFGLPLWRQAQSMIIVDWKNPHRCSGLPPHLRLAGGQPSRTGPVPPSLHGAISAHEHPNAAGKLARAGTAATSSGIVSTLHGASATTA